MPATPRPPIGNPATPDVLARAAKVRLACFDVDGTLTDGRIYLDDDGREAKAFHVHDGMGLSLLRRAGIAVAFVTARDGEVARRRAAELGVEAHVGIKDKRACVEALRARLGLAADEVAFMGDDLADLEALAAAGLAAAPADAHPSILGHVHWQATALGGDGAAREFCDLVLAARGEAGAVDATGARQ